MENDLLFLMAAEPEYGPCLRARIEARIIGVGPVEAAIGTVQALEQRRASGSLPRLVVSLGSAGSHRCEVGSVWQISSVSWRDMDASRFGFEKGVTPFAGHPRVIELPTPIPSFPTATLSTGAEVMGNAGQDEYPGDLADMETFAVVRACERFGVSTVGLRGVSDGPGGADDWSKSLELIDRPLAEAVDRLIAAMR